MKNNFRAGLAIAAITAMTCLNIRGANAETGLVDFGKFSPSQGSEFVEVNIKSNLITMVTNLAKKSEPEVAEVLGGLKAIRVNVLGLNEQNREEIKKRIAGIQTQLDGNGWERVVTALNRGEDVAVFLKMKDAESVEGVVVTVVQSDREAVLVNVVGDIRPEKLSMIGERFNIEPLKKMSAKLGKK